MPRVAWVLAVRRPGWCLYVCCVHTRMRPQACKRAHGQQWVHARMHARCHWCWWHAQWSRMCAAQHGVCRRSSSGRTLAYVHGRIECLPLRPRVSSHAQTSTLAPWWVVPQGGAWHQQHEVNGCTPCCCVGALWVLGQGTAVGPLKVQGGP